MAHLDNEALQEARVLVGLHEASETLLGIVLDDAELRLALGEDGQTSRPHVVGLVAARPKVERGDQFPYVIH